MGDPKTTKLNGDDAAGETRLRHIEVDGVEVDGVAKQKSTGTDQVLRTDGEEDTLYEDGLELENDSRPLTGVNGRDDS